MSNRDWWTPERRQAQRERIQASRPWERSTGPKTPEGKAASSQNASKPNSHRKRINALLTKAKQIMQAQREALDRVG